LARTVNDQPKEGLGCVSKGCLILAAVCFALVLIFGGGGKTEVFEGDWKPKRIVVLQFESMERAKEWLNCEEYREPRKMRHRTTKTNMILVEGV
jgi:uncharacterized protein DUF1330